MSFIQQQLFTGKSTYYCRAHILQKFTKNGTLLFHILLLQGLPEVLQGDLRAIGPQVGFKAFLSYLHTLIHQVEQLVILWRIDKGSLGRKGNSTTVDIMLTQNYTKNEQVFIEMSYPL